MSTPGSPNNDGRCDKASLLKTTEQFLEAKIQDDVRNLTIADDFRATSNGEVVTLGEGETWGPGLTVVNRHTFVDPATRTAVFFGTIAGEPAEDRRWWYVSIRITVDQAGGISEVEELSNAKGFVPPGSLEVPFRESVTFNQVLPEDERMTEAGLLDTADSYWEALTTGSDVALSFSPDSQRSNMGAISTNNPLTLNRGADPEFVPTPRVGWSARGYFDLPQAGYQMINRRYYIVDVPRGLVVGVGQFQQTIEGRFPGFCLMEAFKIRCGLIEWLWGPAMCWDAKQSGWPDWARQ